jgi:hypothetical protein
VQILGLTDGEEGRVILRMGKKMTKTGKSLHFRSLSVFSAISPS